MYCLYHRCSTCKTPKFMKFYQLQLLCSINRVVTLCTGHSPPSEAQWVKIFYTLLWNLKVDFIVLKSLQHWTLSSSSWFYCMPLYVSLTLILILVISVFLMKVTFMYLYVHTYLLFIYLYICFIIYIFIFYFSFD